MLSNSKKHQDEGGGDGEMDVQQPISSKATNQMPDSLDCMLRVLMLEYEDTKEICRIPYFARRAGMTAKV